MNDDQRLEIKSLNAEDLDVEDLERRIELAAAVGADGIWCDINCGTYSPAPGDGGGGGGGGTSCSVYEGTAT